MRRRELASGNRARAGPRLRAGAGSSTSSEHRGGRYHCQAQDICNRRLGFRNEEPGSIVDGNLIRSTEDAGYEHRLRGQRSNGANVEFRQDVESWIQGHETSSDYEWRRRGAGTIRL